MRLHSKPESKVSRNKDQALLHFQYKYHFLSEAFRPSEESARGERSAWSLFSRENGEPSNAESAAHPVLRDARGSDLRATFHLQRVGSEQQEEPGVARYKSALLSMTTSKSAFVSALFHRYYLKWDPGRTPLFCNCGIRAKPCTFCGKQNTRPREFRPDQHSIQVRTRICPEPRTSETSCDAWSDVFGLMD